MYRGTSNESARPLSDVHYQPNGYGSNAYDIPKKKKSKWLLIGLPVLLIVIAGGVVGVVLGLRGKNSNSSSSSSSNNNSGNSPEEIAELGRLATGTDEYWQPLYPSTTDTAAYHEPTFVTTSDPDMSWPEDDFVVTDPSLDNLRPHPRIIAPSYKWNALPNLIEKNPYLKGWHEVIMANATAFSALPPIVHVFDGGPSGSGILDPARETKVRIKHFAYAYKMTSETSWVDRAWRELDNAMNWGEDRADPWNTPHFLDTAELTAAFGIAYDWLYDQWTDDQKATLRNAIIDYGLKYGQQVYSAEGAPFGWWHGATINGNWNCVSNGGLILGSLAIVDDDDTGLAASLLATAVENASQVCVNGPSSDGTWSETANYWYFGATGHAELTSALMTATGGGDFGMLKNNPGFELTGLYHIYVTGMTSLFDYGDHGPNKFSATANSVIFYGSAFDEPLYTLWQRDRVDAAEPWSMFWYDPRVSGAWWEGLALDHVFEDPSDQWASFRTSWTDVDGAFIALKSGALVEHQTHGDLDCGTFIIDALGQRWAGEHGSANYLNTNYFSNETQISDRWTLYRKMTEGQNVIAINGQNQNVDAQPTIRHDNSQTEQGSSTVFEVPQDSTAFIVTDLSTAYFGANVKRGMRFINGRRQILIQDELTNIDDASQWRVQTNATITIDPSGTSATLELADKKLVVQILNAPEGVVFQDLPSERTSNAPPLAATLADESNDPARVLAIDIPAGSITLEVLFNPQWDGFSDFQTPPTVALDDWSLESHN